MQHQQLEMDFLIRGYHNRRSVAEALGENGSREPLSKLIRKQPISGYVTITLQRTPKRKRSRSAKLAIRYARVWIEPPQGASTPEEKQPLKTQVILVEERDPPKTELPVSWLLLTSLEVTNLAQAQHCLELYTYRWLIERYHYTLKSGCNLEKLQLRKCDRIHRALATYSIVAWRLLWLIYTSRENPNQPATIALEEQEWRSLYCVIHKDTIGKTTVMPEKPPTIYQCVRWIASLGGFLGRKCDGEPGVKTLWRGFERLKDVTLTWVMTLKFLKKEILAT